MDFIAGLRPELAIITNGSNPADLDEVEEIAKNVESASLINKNVIAAATNPAVTEVKELKAQILELKAEIKKAKYISREDRKTPQDNEENRKSLTEGQIEGLWIKGILNVSIVEKRDILSQNVEPNQRIEQTIEILGSWNLNNQKLKVVVIQKWRR